MADYYAANEADLQARITTAGGTGADDTVTVVGTSSPADTTPTQTPITLTQQLNVTGAPAAGSLTLNGNLNGAGSVVVSGFTGTGSSVRTHNGGADGSGVIHGSHGRGRWISSG